MNKLFCCTAFTLSTPMENSTVVQLQSFSIFYYDSLGFFKFLWPSWNNSNLRYVAQIAMSRYNCMCMYIRPSVHNSFFIFLRLSIISPHCALKSKNRGEEAFFQKTEFPCSLVVKKVWPALCCLTVFHQLNKFACKLTISKK